MISMIKILIIFFSLTSQFELNKFELRLRRAQMFLNKYFFFFEFELESVKDPSQIEHYREQLDSK